MIFGNLSKFSNNVEGRIYLLKSRFDIKLDTEQRNFRKNGIQKSNIVINKDLLSGVQKLYFAALNDKNKSSAVISTIALNDGIKPACFQVLQKDVPELALLITSEIGRTVKSLIGSYKINYIVARATHHAPTEITEKYDLYSNSWHCDVEPCHRIKLFIALSDIGDDDGPMHAFDRKNTKKILKMGFRNRDNYGIDPTILEKSDNLVKFTGKAGECFFVNVTQCLHKAGIPKDGNVRHIVEIQFEAIDM